MAKLSPERVAALREDRKRGATLAVLVAKYGVSQSQASRITRGENW